MQNATMNTLPEGMSARSIKLPVTKPIYQKIVLIKEGTPQFEEVTPKPEKKKTEKFIDD